jgi:hypothetical protein
LSAERVKTKKRDVCHIYGKNPSFFYIFCENGKWKMENGFILCFSQFTRVESEVSGMIDFHTRDLPSILKKLLEYKIAHLQAK